MGASLPRVRHARVMTLVWCIGLGASMAGMTGPASSQPKRACLGEFEAGQAYMMPNG